MEIWCSFFCTLLINSFIHFIAVQGIFLKILWQTLLVVLDCILGLIRIIKLEFCRFDAARKGAARVVEIRKMAYNKEKPYLTSKCFRFSSTFCEAGDWRLSVGDRSPRALTVVLVVMHAFNEKECLLLVFLKLSKGMLAGEQGFWDGFRSIQFRYYRNLFALVFLCCQHGLITL